MKNKNFWPIFVLGVVASLVVIAALPNAGAQTQPSNQAVSVGAGTRYICQTSAPAPTGRARSWVLCSSGHFIYTDATNMDHDLTP